MYASYGSFVHGDSEVYVASWVRQAVLTQRGFIRSYKVTATLGGRIIGTPAEMSAMMAARVNAYSVSGYDFKIVDNNGSPTDFVLLSAGSYGGVMVTQPITYSKVDGGQYATYLDYQFQLQAEYPFVELVPGTDVLQYHESITFSGGRPIFVVRPTINGEPVEQRTSPRAPYYASQSGFLVTRSTNPPANPPLWPDYLLPSSSLTPMSAEVYRGSVVGQGIQWNYQYASAAPLIGSPRSL